MLWVCICILFPSTFSQVLLVTMRLVLSQAVVYQKPWWLLSGLCSVQQAVDHPEGSSLGLGRGTDTPNTHVWSKVDFYSTHTEAQYLWYEHSCALNTCKYPSQNQKFLALFLGSPSAFNVAHRRLGSLGMRLRCYYITHYTILPLL